MLGCVVPPVWHLYDVNSEPFVNVDCVCDDECERNWVGGNVTV